MGSYIPNTRSQQEEMLSAIGVSRVEELFAAVPHEMLVEHLDLPEGLSELEVRRKVTAMAAKNKVYDTVLRGAGAYRHFIPSVVKSITGREELVTAYTPYQAEISQGILQSIFEYQTMICALTGMEVSNASVYDGSTAAAEALAMCRDRKKNKAYVSACADPQTIAVMRTYCFGSGMELEIIPERDGRTDLEAMKGLLDAGTACVYIQQPNFFGNIEDASAIGEAVHATGAKYIMGCNPIALAVMETPAACGADVAVGEAQPLDWTPPSAGPTWAIWPPRRPCSASCPAVSWARPTTWTAMWAMCSPSRPGSSTSAGRRRPATSAPTRPCAPLPPGCISPPWAARGCGRRRSSP